MPSLSYSQEYLNEIFNASDNYIFCFLVNCQWTSWGSWQSCSVTCGGGTQQRTRTKSIEAQNGGLECPGDLYEIQNCNTNSCLFKDNCCDSIEVYYNGTLKYSYDFIYGYYVRQEDLINGRSWYKNDDNSIWWDDKNDNWMLGKTTSKGSSNGYAYLYNDGRCLPKIPNQKWKLWHGSNYFNWIYGSNWIDAGNKVKIRCGYKPKGK